MGFTFIQISDPHILEIETGRLHGFSPGTALRQVLQHIAAHQAGQFDFLVFTGDTVNTPTPDAYQTFKRLAGLPEQPGTFPGPLLASFAGLKDIPIYCLPGNHDDRDRFYQQLFPQTTPGDLANAAIQFQGVQLIFLDLGPGERPRIPPDTLHFLIHSLQTGQPSILLLHHNVAPMGSRWLDKYISKDIDLFWQALEGRPVLGIFCGHTHVSYAVTFHNFPVYGISSTAIPFVAQGEHLMPLLPPHYRRVSIQAGEISTQVFEVEL
jgi:Icc protein